MTWLVSSFITAVASTLDTTLPTAGTMKQVRVWSMYVGVVSLGDGTIQAQAETILYIVTGSDYIPSDML